MPHKGWGGGIKKRKRHLFWKSYAYFKAMLIGLITSQTDSLNKYLQPCVWQPVIVNHYNTS